MSKFLTKTKYKILVFISFFLISSFYAQTSITAVGNQAFCFGEEINIVTDFEITDLTSTSLQEFFIQISEGYQNGFDKLKLSVPGNHPNISESWNSVEGKLTLSASIVASASEDIEKAVKDVVFITTETIVANIVEEKTFSLSIDNANYLPHTGHFYHFVDLPGISWTEAKVAAENLPLYHGRQGYLATLTNAEEAAFAGEQASGVGWIGGTDEETEGVWKWVTGPEKGKTFWIGTANGTSVGADFNYANWIQPNNISSYNEPNNYGGYEHYAHITHVNLGSPGTWNDLPNEGGGGDYFPQGYIVEYGGMEDPSTVQDVVVTTRIYLPKIKTIIDATVCGSGVATISATVSDGEVYWYDSLTSTEPIFIGNDYSTTILTETKSYFVEADSSICFSLRREVKVLVDAIPEFELEEDTYVLCNDNGYVTLKTIYPTVLTYTYSWTKDDLPISGNSSELTVFEPGVYKVKAISAAGCENFEKVITVKNSEIASIIKDDVLIIDNSENNSIEVINPNLGIGVYEFSVDNELGIYQDAPFFENISTGMHRLFIRDKGGCGITEYVFSILEYPSFFTPNNDNINDLWHIKGYDKDFYTLSDIFIYNRFGVLIYVLSPTSKGWDGTYNGTILPSNSYWFKTSLTDKNGLTVEKSGSFSLLRK